MSLWQCMVTSAILSKTPKGRSKTTVSLTDVILLHHIVVSGYLKDWQEPAWLEIRNNKFCSLVHRTVAIKHALHAGCYALFSYLNHIKKHALKHSTKLECLCHEIISYTYRYTSAPERKYFGPVFFFFIKCTILNHILIVMIIGDKLCNIIFLFFPFK